MGNHDRGREKKPDATDNFLAAIENAFHYFGGVPKRPVIDNLKAAVKRRLARITAIGVSGSLMLPGMVGW